MCSVLVDQTKQEETDEEILKFLESNPESRWTVIWEHIKSLDLVSQKVFDKRLKELAGEDDGRVTKIKLGVDAAGKTISNRMPRYSRTKWVEVEKKLGEWQNNYTKKLVMSIEAIEGNFGKLDDEQLALQFYWFYSALYEIQLVRRIEFAQPNSKTSHEQKKHLEKTLPATTEYLLTIIKKLPKERMDKVLSIMHRLAHEKTKESRQKLSRECEKKIGKKHFWY